MKKTLAIITAAMLTLSLAGCGETGSIANDAGGTGNGAGSAAEYGANLHYGSSRGTHRYPDAQDDAAARSRYGLMLDNGRVHDTDGFLLDGENAQHDTLF